MFDVVVIFVLIQPYPKICLFFLFWTPWKSAGWISSDPNLLHLVSHPGVHQMARWAAMLTIQRTGQGKPFHGSRDARNFGDHGSSRGWETEAPFHEQRVGEIGKAGSGLTAAPHEALRLVSLRREAPRLCPQPSGQLPPSERRGAMAPELDGGCQSPWLDGLLWHDDQLSLLLGGHDGQQRHLPWNEANQSLRAASVLGLPVSAEQQTLNNLSEQRAFWLNGNLDLVLLRKKRAAEEPVCCLLDLIRICGWVVLGSRCLASPEKKTAGFPVVLPAGWISSFEIATLR